MKDTLRLTLTDKGNDTVLVHVTLITDSGVTFGANAVTVGGNVTDQRVNTETADFTVQTAAGPSSFTIDLPTTCTNAYGSPTDSSVHIAVTRDASGTWIYTLEDRAALDGGTSRDGGP